MTKNTLSAVLRDPATIRFIPGTDEADLGDILLKNPQRTSDGYVWFMPDRKTEYPLKFVGKLAYGAIGDKTGPYFSLPDKLFLEDVTAAELAKLKVGFAVRLINRDLVVDTLHSDEFNDHNQAVLEFFLSVQEDANKKLDATLSNHAGEQPVINVKSLLKIEDGNPFFVLPICSKRIFPHFKGPKPLGVTRAKNQKGRISLNPNSTQDAHEDGASPCITFGDLPDPKDRYGALKENETYRRHQMCIPPVFDIDNRLVEPGKYEDMIPDGSLVAVHGKLKMYNIPVPTRPGDRPSVNRPYMFIFDRLQVIDEDDDSDVDWEEIYAETGKRSRSPNGPASTEPSPKRAALAVDVDEEL